MVRGPQPNIPPLVPAVIAVVVVGVLVLVVAGTIGDDTAQPVPSTVPQTTTTIPVFDPPSTTTTLPDAVPVDSVLTDVPQVDAPRSYEITYDIVENSLERQERWVVVRPYESLITSTREGQLLSGTATSRAALRTYLSDREGWLTVQPELHRASFDQRPSGSLPILQYLGLVEQTGEGEVLGRACTWYRTGQPTAGSTKAPPSEQEWTEFCIDGAGLVLQETWYLEGELLTDRVATSLDLDVDPDPSIFEGGERIADDEEYAAAFQSVAVPADQETIDGLQTTLEPPGGYELDGAVFRATLDQSGGASASEVVRFYASGADLLEVSELFFGGGVGLGNEGSVRIEVDGWEEVWLEGDFRSAVLRARLDDATAVELRHHDPAFLIEVLGLLERRS